MDPHLRRLFERHRISSCLRATSLTLVTFVLVEIAASLLINASASLLEHLVRAAQWSVPIALFVGACAAAQHWWGLRVLAPMLTAPETIHWAYGAREVNGGKTHVELWDGRGNVAHLLTNDPSAAVSELHRFPWIVIGHGSQQRESYEAHVGWRTPT